MVICLVVSQLMVFACLFLGTLNLKGHISRWLLDEGAKRWNVGCLVQALLTYYSILSSFNWMTAMSYNIMTKFR